MSPITVALAGGSGGLGRYILDELLSQGKHKVVVLTREPRADLEKIGVIVETVDYNNHESLVNALRGVHTIISFIWSSEGGLKDSQIGLLKAAVEAGVKRFAPSEWALDSLTYQNIPQYADKLPIREVLKQSNLEYTLFFNGLFLNYFGKEAGYLRGVGLVFDVKNGKAVIPGTGDEPLTVTHTKDIAKYVVAALEQPKWREVTGIEGERTTFNKILEALQRVTGKEFEIIYKPASEFEENIKQSSGPLMDTFMDYVKLSWINGQGTVSPSTRQDFPEIKPIGVDEFIQQAWGQEKQV
ncbi:hypothetical protein K7432_006551 [Basidiobolus ranarum]|uniref:NmrA-like domain-containing protein n=1 Tax=Basidiobolus ranarum TaxID=34480 RepID=A0ABR2WUV7_9FUNG